jgi:hypothetical protein
MNQNQQITKFIKHVAGSNYSTANKLLQGIINEKIKNRIRKVDADLANKTKKAS